MATKGNLRRKHDTYGALLEPLGQNGDFMFPTSFQHANVFQTEGLDTRFVTFLAGIYRPYYSCDET